MSGGNSEITKDTAQAATHAEVGENDGQGTQFDHQDVAQAAADRFREDLQGPSQGAASVDLRALGLGTIEANFETNAEHHGGRKGGQPKERVNQPEGAVMTDCFPNDMDERLRTKFTAPLATKEQVQSAQDTLNSQIRPNLKPEEKEIVKAIQDAALGSNADNFSTAIDRCKDDPARLDVLLTDINKNLQDNNAGLNVTMDKNNNVVLYGDHGRTAVQFGLDGSRTVKSVKHDFDETTVMTDEEVLNKKPSDVMAKLSNKAVLNIEENNNEWGRLDPNLRTLDASVVIN